MEELIAKSNQNKFQLNESKCKELQISFAKSAADFAPIVINGKAIEVVSTVKLLGLNISSDRTTNNLTVDTRSKYIIRPETGSRQDVGVDVCDFAPCLAMLYGRNC